MNLKRAIGWLFLGLFCFSGLLFAERVLLQDGTPVRVRLKADLLSDRTEEGNRVDFEVARPVTAQGLVIIPVGAVAWGAVQSLKKDKYIRFDIEGVRLPDLREVKLRSIRDKSKNAGKDQIKLETEYGSTVGAPKGGEFTAYLDEDVWVEVAAAPPTTAPAVRPAPPAPPPVVQTPAPATVPPARQSAPVAPAVATPTARAPAPALATAERVRVECFSDPLGADILIDGEFYGNTPSELKVAVGVHRLEFQLAGYKTHSESLNLTAGTGLRTIKASLEKKE